jgi:cytochrome P450
MIRHWSSKSSINSIADDTRTVSLHVISAAAFGKSYPFRGFGEVNSSSTEDFSSYGEALRLILDRCIPLLILGRKNLSQPWLPKSFRELYQATLVFQDYMTKEYEEGKQAMVRGEKQEYNLLTSLVRASQAESQQASLTEEEVYGNIFVFSFAGHDATGNSLAFGISLMATRPDVQDWISDEINCVLAGVDSEESSYEAVFPHLKRCLAVTVRDPLPFREHS